MEEKRRKYSISSDNSDTTDSQTTSTSKCSKIPSTKSSWSRQKEKKPSEVFRTDLITAMKIPDSFQLSPDEYYILADPWRQEWEKGVQVPANTETIPEPEVRITPLLDHSSSQSFPRNLSGSECSDASRTYSQRVCRYDLDEIDACWLELFNMELKEMASFCTGKEKLLSSPLSCSVCICSYISEVERCSGCQFFKAASAIYQIYQTKSAGNHTTSQLQSCFLFSWLSLEGRPSLLTKLLPNPTVILFRKSGLRKLPLCTHYTWLYKV